MKRPAGALEERGSVCGDRKEAGSHVSHVTLEVGKGNAWRGGGASAGEGQDVAAGREGEGREGGQGVSRGCLGLSRWICDVGGTLLS